MRQGETRPSGSKNHPTKGNKKGHKKGNKKGNKGRPGETMGDKRRQGETRPLGKADTPSNKGTQGERRPSGRRIQQRETGRETRGDNKEPGGTDPWEGGHTIQQRDTRRETRGDKGRQDPREGGHTIQHQGGHLKTALRTLTAHCLGKN